jgi:hypothetical protein
MVSTADRPTPTLEVPEADSAKDLATAAESGFAAIQALFAERNKSVELSQNLHRHNVYLLNVNNGLAHELRHARQERDHYMRMFARSEAHLKQCYDILGRVLGEAGHTACLIEGMEPTPVPTNNPTAPEIDTVGRPLEADHAAQLRVHQSYDGEGLPLEGPPPVTRDELHALAARINGKAAQ